MDIRPAASAHRIIENTLGILLLALVWLAPNHQSPWGSFHHELLMAISLAAICVLLLWQTRWRLPVPLFAGLVLLAIAVPWLQWATGVLPKSGTALVSSSYIASLGLAICVGYAGAREPAGERLFQILFGALILAAVLNVPVQVVQWYQWYEHDFESLLLLLVTPISAGNRPSGMLLQPNQLATIQVWGLVGLSWFRYHRRISRPFFLLSFVLISAGIGLTQSRVGLLEIITVSGLMFLALRRLPHREILWIWLGTILGLTAWAINFPAVAKWMGVSETGVARLSAIDGARIDAWRAFWGAVMERPWFGYGVSDSGYAYVALAEEHPDLFIGQRFAHAHNSVLDLLLWVGLPLGAIIIVVFSCWLVLRLLSIRKLPHTVFPLAVLVALGLHSMLELPHQFLYFIVPAGLCVGWLCGSMPDQRFWTLPRSVWGASSAVVIAVTTLISLDYFPYQERYTEWRFEHQRIGERTDIPVHKPLVLNQIHDELVLYRMPLTGDLSAMQLQWIADTASSVNSPPAYIAAAKAFALAGQTKEAHRWMMRFNAIMDPTDIRQMKQIWQRDQKQNPQLASMPWPEYQGRTSTFVMPPLDASPKMSSVPKFLPQDNLADVELPLPASLSR